MDALRSLWGADRPPVPIDQDEVYATHFLDNKKAFEAMLLVSTWCFNDVLDADKLSAALSRLLEIGDWRKLGGRCRRGHGRTLELHVPAKFSPERPAIDFSHDVLGMRLRDHALYRKIPRRTEGLSFHPSVSELRPLSIKPGTPETLADLLKGDRPALSLHIVSFDDATIVNLTWPHNLMDAIGLSTLVKAWSLVLAGLDAEVPPLLGAHHDVLYELAGSEAAQQEESAFARMRLKGCGMFVFVVHAIWDLLLGSRMEERILCLPKEAVQRLRDQALADLSVDGDNEGERPWVSEHDASLAVWAKCFALAQPRPRPVMVLFPFDARSRLPGTINRDDSYVQNLVLESSHQVSAELAESPLGHIAWTFRQTLRRHTTTPQILALLRSLRGLWDSGGEPMMLSGPPNAKLLLATDWGRARLFHVAEFGPAVTRQGEEDDERRNPVGSPFWQHSVVVRLSAMFSRNTMVHLGKDHEGNTWHMGILSRRNWELIEATVENLQILK